MNKLDTKISKHAKDIIQKYTSGLFKDVTLEFYGIKTAKIKELINVELPIVETSETSMDFIFLLEDNTYLHFEFQSSYNKSDLLRFALYDLRVYERDGRIIHTVVIYTANVKEVPEDLNIGSLTYEPSRIMMADYDGERIYTELEAKIRNRNDLTDVDMLNLIFLPLMRNTIPKEELAVNSIKLAQTIEDEKKRNTCIGSIFSFASRYLDGSKLDELLEVIRMTDLATMLITERDIEIAKKALKKGYAVNDIAEITGLDESTILQLQEELEEE